MPETLPGSKRRPFRPRDANPFGFLRLFGGGGSSAPPGGERDTGFRGLT
jgi:hypothetical protein